MLLSIIITAHDEGLLLHKAILSVNAALSYASINDFEIIVHIDNITQGMKSYVESDAFKNHNIILYKNTFCDLSDSRNFCVNKASGDYIFFIDADDLISNNFFINAMPLVEKDCVLVHPESCLSFDDAGKGRTLWIMSDSGDMKEDAYTLFEKNLWISSVLGKKKVFKDNPYKKIHNGYGNEDYAFNLETLGKNIPHRVAPKTVYFYRKKVTSLLSKSNSNRLTQRRVNLFDLNYWKESGIGSEAIANKPGTLLKSRIKTTGRNAYISARNNALLNTFITPVATLARGVTGIKKNKSSRIPDYIYAQWKNISEIEPQLYPTKCAIKDLGRYDAHVNNMASRAYSRLARTSTINSADYIFIVPWVNIGGADKVLINYLNAMKEIRPDWRIAVITTLPSKNEWASKIPDNACLFDYGNEAKVLYNDEEKDILLTRLIVQLQSNKIHIINSEFAYKWAYNHKLLIEANYDLRISLFCHDIIPNTNGKGIFDYADPYASRIEPYVNHIFTDNDAEAKRLISNYGFRKDIIKTHFQPFVGKIKPPKKTPKKEKMRILWASRICTQKKPELVAEIAKQLNSSIYHIDMYGRLDPRYDKKMFSNINSLSYCGSFNGLDSISNIEQYDCFLYTSFVDGLPNIILEVAALGLPIISSDAGGIKDFIKNEDTGILVSSNDVADYVKALEHIRDNPEFAMRIANNATKLLKERHSWNSFIDAIKEDF